MKPIHVGTVHGIQVMWYTNSTSGSGLYKLLRGGRQLCCGVSPSNLWSARYYLLQIYGIPIECVTDIKALITAHHNLIS